MTAAHVANATSATTLLLDEPTLFMHPTLENKLLRLLLDPTDWDPPMQLVIATHSPLLVDAAYRKGKLCVTRWKTPAKDSAEIVEFTKSNAGELVRTGLVTPSELVHGPGILFVEGPSDLVALKELSALCDRPRRLVPLNEPDLFKRNRSGRLAFLFRAGGDGFSDTPAVLWDLDKRTEIETERAKTSLAEEPRIDYAGTASGKDLESCFCDQDFLVQFFSDRLKPAPDDLAGKVAAALRRLGENTGGQVIKGDQVLASLFLELALEREDKPAQLRALAAFFVESHSQPWAAAVATNLRAVLDALEASTGEPRP